MLRYSRDNFIMIFFLDFFLSIFVGFYRFLFFFYVEKEEWRNFLNLIGLFLYFLTEYLFDLVQIIAEIIFFHSFLMNFYQILSIRYKYLILSQKIYNDKNDLSSKKKK